MICFGHFLSAFIVNIKKNYDFSYKMKGVVTDEAEAKLLLDDDDGEMNDW